MKKIRSLLLLGLVSLFFGTSYSQHLLCDGIRFSDNLFDSIKVSSGIEFGFATTIGGNPKTLYMDIYEPVGDTMTNRPVIVFAHGGSFTTGNRGQMSYYCEYYAKKGYVTASIDYRLWDLLFPSDTLQIVHEVMMALSDMKASIRFFKESFDNGNPYGIDPGFIFAGGISAGAIMACHAGAIDSSDYLNPELMAQLDAIGGFEGNSSTNTQYNSEIKGVLNWSGALKVAEWWDENDPPVFSAHDDQDGTVPYGTDVTNAMFIPVSLSGSEAITAQATSVGVYNELITIPNSSDHVSYFFGSDTLWEDSVMNGSTAFLHNVLCELYVGEMNELENEELVNVYPNPIGNQFKINYSGKSTNWNLKIFNSMGAEVYTRKKIETKELELNNVILVPGYYFIEVESEGHRQTFKISK